MSTDRVRGRGSRRGGEGIPEIRGGNVVARQARPRSVGRAGPVERVSGRSGGRLYKVSDPESGREMTLRMLSGGLATDEESVVTVPAPGVLANDQDID